MEDQQRNARGVLGDVQSACAVISGLLLVGLLAYAFAAGEWNFAGPMPAEGELATIWQKLDAAQDPAGEANVVRRR
jgi:hypothetical protein